MRTEILDGDDANWSEYLAGVAHDFYHRPEYVRLEAQRIEAQPQAFVATEGNKLFFVPYLVRSCEPLFPLEPSLGPAADVVSPYGYPGFLYNDAGHEPDFAKRAFDGLSRTLADHGICSGFFRLHPILNADLPTLFPPDLFTDNGETVAFDLRLDPDAIWRGVREGHRATINKCKRAGFTVRRVPLSEYLDEFMTAYQETMDRVKAKDSYYFSRDYFLELARMPDHVSCLLGEFAGKVATACIFFECGGIAQAHLGGTKNEFMAKSPFHFLLHQAALHFRERGNRFLHLGGGVGGADDPLHRFKAGFSHLRFRFATLRLLTDEARYLHFVNLRARAVNVSPESLMSSSFFPAYRAMN